MRLACLLLALTLLTLSASSTCAQSPKPTFFRLALPSRPFATPAVYGNRIAWAATIGSCKPTAACSTVIYTSRISPFQAGVVAHVAHGKARVGYLELRLSDHWLVWIDGVYPAPGWWLWARNVQTGITELVASSANEGGPAT